MIEEIENEFKKKIIYNFKSNLLTILFILMIIISLIIEIKFGFFWMLIIPSLSILIGGIYAYLILKTKIKKKIKIKDMFALYKDIKYEENRKVLLSILRNNGVNTKMEIELLIKHYQNKIPKKIYESSQFLSILALLSSFFFFVIDPDFSTIEEKIRMLLEFIISISLIYFCLYSVIKEIKEIHSVDNFNIMMEKYLIEIIVKDIVN